MAPFFEKHKHFLNENAVWFTRLLALCYFLSLLAEHMYLLDLFSHFSFQYLIGALLLVSVLLACKNWKYTALAATILVCNAYEIYNATDWQLNHAATGNTFTIVQYNRRYKINNHDNFINWVYKNKNDIDMIVLQEAREAHVKAAIELKELFPYQIHEPRHNAFGMVILSKYAFKELRPIVTTYHALNNFIINVKIVTSDGNEISIYAVHPPPPTNSLLLSQRNNDIFLTAEHIANDNTPSIIMAGDWNITPYSPYFDELKKRSGLKYEITTIFPAHTWPSPFILPLFQIPIDHILYKGDLRLISKERGPAMGSDHYPLIATFGFSR